jgi:hypothetical protein
VRQGPLGERRAGERHVSFCGEHNLWCGGGGGGEEAELEFLGLTGAGAVLVWGLVIWWLAFWLCCGWCGVQVQGEQA